MAGERATAFRLPRRTLIEIGLGFAAALLALALAVVAIVEAQRAVFETIATTRQAFARMTASQVRLAIGTAAAGVRAVAAQPSLPRMLAAGDSAGVAAMLREVQRNALFIDALAVVGAHDAMLVAHPESSGGTLATAGAGLATGAFRDVRDGTAVLVLREPIPGTGWSLVAALSLRRIVARVGIASFGSTGAVTIARRSGDVVVSSDPLRRGRAYVAQDMRALLGRRAEGVLEYDSPTVRRRELVAVAPVRDVDLSVVISQSHDEVFGSLAGLRRNLGWLALGLFAVAAALALRTLRARRRAFRALGASERRYRDLVEASAGLISEHDLSGRLVMVNPAAAAHLGYERGEMEGRRLHHFVPRDRWPELDAYLASIARIGVAHGVLALTARNGQVQLWEYANRYYAEPGRAPYVIGHAQDVTERRAREALLREEGQRDPLTGALNRRFLDEFERAAARDAVWGCLVVDLDRFKEINDRHGHQRGDEVLVQVARLLMAHARHGDAVVRMGGDEFAILLADGTHGAADAVAARLREDGARAPCGFSVGVAIRERGEPLAATLDRADQRLYSLRRQARGARR